MADQGIWAKLWCSSLDDPSLDNLPIDDFGRWSKMTAYTKRHGTEGVLTIERPCRVLVSALQVRDFDDLIVSLERLPRLSILRDGDPVTSAIVTFSNWKKYQGDNSADRMRRLRARVTAKKRGEEKRGEEKGPPYPPVEKSTALPDPQTEGLPGLPLERPPSAHAADMPEYVSSCPACVALLRAINEAAGTLYGAPGKAGMWMHAAHERSGLDACLAAILRQAAQLDGGKRRFLAPAILFKPENWDVTVNEPSGPKRKTLTQRLKERGLA